MGRDPQPRGGGGVKSVAPKTWRLPDSPTPPFNGEPRAKNLLPRPNSIEPLNSRPMGMPRHVREQMECEARFQLLPLIAVEPFPEGEMEWDRDGTTPSPLRPLESWPRLRGRRQHKYPEPLTEVKTRILKICWRSILRVFNTQLKFSIFFFYLEDDIQWV